MKLHPKTERIMRKIGEDIRTWRVTQRLTATSVADRAGITRVTLRAIERNPGSASFENVMSVLAVLGLDEAVGTAIDPTQSIRGQTLLTAAARKEI